MLSSHSINGIPNIKASTFTYNGGRDLTLITPAPDTGIIGWQVCVFTDGSRNLGCAIIQDGGAFR